MSRGYVNDGDLKNKAKLTNSSGCAVYLIGIVVIFAVFSDMNDKTWNITVAIALFVAVALLILYYMPYKKRIKKEKIKKEKKIRREEKKEIDKIFVDNSYKNFPAELRKWAFLIDNKQIKIDLYQMSKIVSTINEKSIETGQMFYTRHSETILKLLKQYDDMEESGVASEARNHMEFISKSISLANEAFKQELNNLFKKDMLEIDAELTAYMQSLKNRGIIE